MCHPFQRLRVLIRAGWTSFSTVRLLRRSQRRQEALRPVSKCAKTAKQPRAFGQTVDHICMVDAQPSIEGFASYALYGVEKPYGASSLGYRIAWLWLGTFLIVSSTLQDSTVIKSTLSLGCSSSANVVQLTEWSINVAFSTMS